jgi:hypothetical protein
MKHIRTTSRQRQMPAPAISNFVALLRFFVILNQQIIEAIFRFGK